MIVTPVIGSVLWVRSGFSSVFYRYIHLMEVERENESLQKENELLRESQTLCEAWQRENERLTDLLEIKRDEISEAITARIVSYPIMGEFDILFINRGREEGVRRGFPVITSRGLVGRVIEAGPHRSKVLLVTDPTSSVDARVVRTGARGLVVGHGKEIGFSRPLFIGALEFWDRSSEVIVGDELVTSGLDEVFPADIPIGTVRSVKGEEGELFLNGEVVPSVEMNKVQEVLVIRPS